MCFEESVIGTLLSLGRAVHRRSEHPQPASCWRISRGGKLAAGSFFLERHADEAPFGVFQGVLVVSYVAVLEGEERMVFSDADILAGKPFRACARRGVSN